MIHQQDFELSITSTTRPECGTQKGCATFTYDSSDPLVILTHFPCIQKTHHEAAESSVASVWYISREILLEAILFPGKLAGSSDVKILDDVGTNTVVLFLDVPQGTAAVRMMREDISTFLSETLEIVPTENEQDVVVAELDSFLSGLISEE